MFGRLHSLRRVGKLAEHAQLGAIEVQKPDADDANDAEATEQAGPARNAEVVEQRVGKHDAAAGENADLA